MLLIWQELLNYYPYVINVPRYVFSPAIFGVSFHISSVLMNSLFLDGVPYHPGFHISRFPTRLSPFLWMSHLLLLCRFLEVEEVAHHHHIYLLQIDCCLGHLCPINW